jgi:mannose-6-phosphate isomerase-like protein (cupin superfamily)
MSDERTPVSETSRRGHPIADRPAPPDLAGAPASSEPVERFELSAIQAEQLVAGKPYLEFLRRERLSVGLYVLEAGAEDLQRPHTEDEVYHVLEGQAVLVVGGAQHPVKPGSTIFVAAGVPHRFHSIAARLAVLVVFAPAEGTQAR